MLLRWLVSTYLKQAAQQKLMEAVAEAARGQMGAGSAGEEGEQAPLPPCEIAFLFALGIESGGLVDLLADVVTTRSPSFVEHAGYLNGRRVVIIESGVGQACAARAAADVISIHRPAWVVSTGFAGALVDKVKRGHFVFAESVKGTESDTLSLGLNLAAPPEGSKLNWHVGRLLTVDKLIRKEAEKRELGAVHEALACDMETLAVAKVCKREQMNFLAVRIISDAVDDKLPKEAERLMGKKSLAFKLGAAFGAVLDRPASVKELWQLREDAIRASDRLASFLAGVAEQLPQKSTAI